MDFTLKALDLIERHGFNDAMVFFDVLEDEGYSGELDEQRLAKVLVDTGGLIVQKWPDDPIGTTLHEVVLYKVVSLKLMPKLLGFTLVLDPLCSNSVRLKEGWDRDTEMVSGALKGISARISSEEVLAVAADVIAAYNSKTGDPAASLPSFSRGV